MRKLWKQRDGDAQQSHPPIGSAGKDLSFVRRRGGYYELVAMHILGLRGDSCHIAAFPGLHIAKSKMSEAIVATSLSLRNLHLGNLG